MKDAALKSLAFELAGRFGVSHSELRTKFRAARRVIRRVLFAGLKFYCPCCQSWVRKFRPFGIDPRPSVQCPVCGSLERHRALVLYLRSHALWPRSGQRVLHVAPESALEESFRNSGALYVSLDLLHRGVDVLADITRAPFRSRVFDLVVASHVLEHIPDDYAAMRELARLLDPHGVLILLVPLDPNSVTREDPSIVDPAERARLFGQPDHVRMYGNDFPSRLASAGLDATPIMMSPEDWSRHRVDIANDVIWHCVRSGE